MAQRKLGSETKQEGKGGRGVYNTRHTPRLTRYPEGKGSAAGEAVEKAGLAQPQNPLGEQSVKSGSPPSAPLSLFC